jgi:hypothetical protein
LSVRLTERVGAGENLVVELDLPEGANEPTPSASHFATPSASGDVSVPLSGVSATGIAGELSRPPGNGKLHPLLNMSS